MVRVHRLSRFLCVSDKAEEESGEKKSLGLACLKQVLHFNKESQLVLFDCCALCSQRSALLLLFLSHQLDFMLLVLKFNRSFLPQR